MTYRRFPIFPALAAAGAAFALLAAGCGGAGGAPGVASVASSATGSAPATTSQGGSGSGPSGAPKSIHGGFQVAMNVGNTADGAKFSACMRKHGVTNFPDPNSQGQITFGSDNGIDPNSPSFQSARSACQKLLPNGGQPTPAQQAQMQQQLLALAQCMRAHGIKDFPDPSGHGIQLKSGPGSDLNPQNPQFQSAMQACQGKLPGKLGHVQTGPPGK